MFVLPVGYHWYVGICPTRIEVLNNSPDDTLARKVNTSDASVYAEMVGCCGSRVWGFIWLIQAFVFFGLGIIVGLVSFKVCLMFRASRFAHI
jgi:Peptidase M50B-like